MDGMLAFLASVYDEERYPKLVEKVVNAMEYNRVVVPSDDPFAKIFGAEDVPAQESVEELNTSTTS